MDWFYNNKDLMNFLISSSSMIIYLVTAIFIYWQLKELKRTMRGNTHESTMNHATGITKLFIEYPELNEIWKNNSSDTKDINDDLEVKRNWTVELLIDFFEHIFIQYSNGNLPEEAWEGWEQHIKNSFSDSLYFQKLWHTKKSLYSEEFQKFVDRGEFITSKIKDNSGICI